MSAKLTLIKPEVGDDVLLSLALELEREQEETLQRLFNAVESDDLCTAKSLVKELRGECGAASN